MTEMYRPETERPARPGSTFTWPPRSKLRDAHTRKLVAAQLQHRVEALRGNEAGGAAALADSYLADVVADVVAELRS